MSTIAFISDFGTRDWFVGAMKGVALGIDPSTPLVDISHEVSPGDVASAAFVLQQSYPSFAKGTVFCVVVDPGVGSSRAALACKAGGYLFVGPDNGVLSYPLSEDPSRTVYRLENSAYFRTPVSATFHGRDIFAAVSAHLARGTSLEDMGSPTNEYVKLLWPTVELSASSVKGRIVYVDRFGNAFSNLTAAHVNRFGSTTIQVMLAGTEPISLCHHYAERPKGQALSLINSSGYLEIAVNGGNASERLGLRPGDPVTVRVAKARASDLRSPPR